MIEIETSSQNKSQYWQAVGELLLASVLWGASFTWVLWALQEMSPIHVMLYRFLLAFTLSETLHFIFFRNDFSKSKSDRLLALPAGFFMALSLLLQTQGLVTTTATNSSFITSLYVVFIPIVNAIFFRQKIKAPQIALGFLGIIGMAFLLDIQQGPSQFLKSFTPGDGLTLLCAVSSAFHIILVGRASRQTKSAFRFNTYQSFWTLIFLLPFLFFENSSSSGSSNFLMSGADWPSSRALLSVLALALLVTMIAFFLQIRAQKTLSTTTASLLCLLEAPNALLFAFFFLSESLNLPQLFGIILILGSSAYSVFIERPE